MLLSSALGQHVGEATANTGTDVVGDAAGDGRERGRAASCDASHRPGRATWRTAGATVPPSALKSHY
jgi:hypothetical protein